MAYIDADKQNQIAYWEELVPRLRPGGLIVTDNTLYHGTVLDESADPDSATAGVRAFNDHVSADTRMESVLLAISDGLTLSRKRVAVAVSVAPA